MIGLGWRYRRSCTHVVVLQILVVALSLSGLGLTGVGIDLIGHRLDPQADPHKLPAVLDFRRPMAGDAPIGADRRLDPRLCRS